MNKNVLMRQFNVATIHQDSNVTIRQVTLLDDSGGVPIFVTGRGVARRNPIDKNDQRVADLLSTSRAFASAAIKLQRRADGRVKMLDDLATGKVRSGGDKGQKPATHKVIKVSSVAKTISARAPQMKSRKATNG